MKIKQITILTASCAASLALNSCYSIPSPAMGYGMAGPNSSSMRFPDAKQFADNLVKLEVNKSTKQEALALLGPPNMKKTMNNSDFWSYSLRTGGMPAMAGLHFKDDIFVGVDVTKTSFDGPVGAGSINMDGVYSRGTMSFE
jgi:hypothetical protein